MHRQRQVQFGHQLALTQAGSARELALHVVKPFHRFTLLDESKSMLHVDSCVVSDGTSRRNGARVLQLESQSSELLFTPL